MTVFGKYAQFYDSLYQDKDYEAECDFLEEIFSRFASSPAKSILDLGCGTGGHAIVLANRGYEVTGVDRSEVMLAAAREKCVSRPVDFHLADIREVRLEGKFDAVISMFAVMSYMTTNHDLMTVFQTVRTHLQTGGLFVFDSWFGPAVFRELPGDRCKEVLAGNDRIIRFTRSELDPVEQVVTVHFKLFRISSSNSVQEVTESHVMRPLFVKEVGHMTELTGLELVIACPFMKLDGKLNLSTWDATYVVQAK